MKRFTSVLLFWTLVTVQTFGQKNFPNDRDSDLQQISPPHTFEIVKDIDGNNYHTVKIGDQIWMVENLKVTHYRNGAPIENYSKTDFCDKRVPLYIDYEGNPALSKTFGRLYNWFAATDPRNIAPQGWHVPSKEEWQILFGYLGGEDVAGGKLKEAGPAHWKAPNTGGTNESGFTALPYGTLNAAMSCAFEPNKGKGTIFWTTSGKVFKCVVTLSHKNGKADIWCTWSPSEGIYVRCVKD